VLGDFAQQLAYEVVAFEAVDADGVPIYHTNVLMCVGTSFAAVCSACIRENERAAVLDALRATGHAIVDLSMEQLGEFAGNMLELRSAHSQRTRQDHAAGDAPVSGFGRQRRCMIPRAVNH
jgi:hypothetical protein